MARSSVSQMRSLRGPRIRQQDVAFRLRPVPVDHHVDGVARLERDRAIRLAQLLNGDNAFELVSDVDDDFRGRDFDDVALEQLAFRGRRQMAVVFDEMFEIVFRREADFEIPFNFRSRSRCRLPSQSLDKSLIAQYFRTIADVDGLVNLGV